MNHSRLIEACAALSNAKQVRMALGRETGIRPFERGADGLVAAIPIAGTPNPSAILAAVRAGANLIQDGVMSRRNAINIDVEGFELEMLQGLGALIGAPSLRAVGAETHFCILNERGLPNAQAMIEAPFLKADFRAAWPDSRPIIATRAG